MAGALFCKDCGASIGQTRVFTSDPGMRSVAAFLLSVIPGLGHIYQHHPWRGIMWFGAVMMGYAMGPIGWILHLICAANAALYGRIREDVVARRMRRRERLSRASADFRM